MFTIKLDQSKREENIRNNVQWVENRELNRLHVSTC